MDIDFVVTWVDGNDKAWLERKNKYDIGRESDINTDIRYRDYGLFKYWFRAIEKNAPWVNKVYLVTEGHLPEWLNKDCEKLVIIKHSDYIPDKYLPTFSSNPIELNLHRIKSLSEQFVLFSDDVFLMKETRPSHFFKNGLPKDLGILSPVIPDKKFSNTIFNDVRLINRHFNKSKVLRSNLGKFFNVKYGLSLYRTFCMLPWRKFTGFYNIHVTSALLKSTFEKVWVEEYDELDQTSSNKFRTIGDVNHWAMKYWQIASGYFSPMSPNWGKSYTLNEFSKLKSNIQNEKNTVICINDDYNVKDYEEKMEKLADTFEEKFPQKSEFEL